MQRDGRIQAIDRAVMILRLFSEKRRELRLSDIASDLGLNKSTVYGILSTLKYHGLIDQDEESQKYRLGLGLLELGSIVKNSMDIREIAEPLIKEICDQVQETVHLGTLDKLEVVYIDKQESNQSMRIFTNVGARKPAYCTAVGKAMLAYLPQDVLMELLPDEMPKFTPKTFGTKSELMKELSKIRENGYAVDDEEYNEGLKCVGAPIFDHAGNAKYAVSVSGPAIRMTTDKVKEAINIVTAAAKEISHRLGFRE